MCKGEDEIDEWMVSWSSFRKGHWKVMAELKLSDTGIDWSKVDWRQTL